MDALSWRHKVGVVAYCIMPNHVHSLLRPISAGLLSGFIQQWKRITSEQIQAYLHLGKPNDLSPFGARVRDQTGDIHVWHHRYYPFNVYTTKKTIEKLEYMHNNPVKAGLVDNPCDWPWSSASYYLKGERSRVRLVPPDGPIVFRYDY